jgi:hypothetical protein
MPRISKRWEITDRKVIRTIRELAARPGAVRATTRATQDMAELRLTRAGICHEICEWIDAGKAITCTITTNDPAHVGEPAYELYPEIEGVDVFVKVGLVQRGSETKLLLIISAHRDGGGEGS